MPWIIIGPRNSYEVFVDDEDVALVERFTWRLDGKSVSRTNWDNGIQRKIRLHRAILLPPDDMVVDHIDHNPLNNSRCNLRVCSHQENSRHRQQLGVYREGTTGKYRAQIMHERKSVFLGLFNTYEEAKEAFINKAKELRGEFAAHVYQEKSI